jgi:predicted ATP-grasp superfamily ATP-dependent carboligase
MSEGVLDLRALDVLIPDGETLTVLPILRSLARKNVEVGVAAPNKSAISFYSRYCKNKVWCSSPRYDIRLFLKTVQKIAAGSYFDMLLPAGDCALIPLSENREKIPPYIKFPFASKEAIRTTFKKTLTLKLAMANDIPIPQTFFVNSMRDLKRSSEKMSYPAVIKPSQSWVWDGDIASHHRACYVNTPQSLLFVYKQMHAYSPFPIVQEYIPGITYSVGVLYNHSKLRAICCIKQHRTIPVLGGWATFRETVKLDPKMRDYTLRLMRALNWHGVAEVEFRVDSRDFTPKLMEINGRFWGSVELAITSGIDFPYLLYRLEVDGDVNPVFSYRAGIKRRWLQGDLGRLFTLLTNKNAPRNIEYKEKWREILEFLKFLNESYDGLYIDDLAPFMMSLLSTGASLSSTIFPLLRKKTDVASKNK